VAKTRYQEKPLPHGTCTAKSHCDSEVGDQWESVIKRNCKSTDNCWSTCIKCFPCVSQGVPALWSYHLAPIPAQT